MLIKITLILKESHDIKREFGFRFTMRELFNDIKVKKYKFPKRHVRQLDLYVQDILIDKTKIDKKISDIINDLDNNDHSILNLSICVSLICNRLTIISQYIRNHPHVLKLIDLDLYILILRKGYSYAIDPDSQENYITISKIIDDDDFITSNGNK